jgi:hypothetical protein
MSNAAELPHQVFVGGTLNVTSGSILQSQQTLILTGFFFFQRWLDASLFTVWQSRAHRHERRMFLSSIHSFSNIDFFFSLKGFSFVAMGSIEAADRACARQQHFVRLTNQHQFLSLIIEYSTLFLFFSLRLAICV